MKKWLTDEKGPMQTGPANVSPWRSDGTAVIFDLSVDITQNRMFIRNFWRLDSSTVRSCSNRQVVSRSADITRVPCSRSQLECNPVCLNEFMMFGAIATAYHAPRILIICAVWRLI
jgi:hypothetical protein